MQGGGHDIYTQEIIKNALNAIGDEMFDALARTSMSPIIYETLDYSVGMTMKNGELITQGNGTTAFLGMIDAVVKDVLEKYGVNDAIQPGDVFISNDPYIGTHLSDVALVKPVFHDGELVAFLVNKAHWVDVGGSVPGSFSPSTTEIFQEGLQIPTVKIVEGGQLVSSVLEMVKANIRVPAASVGDFWAGVAANNVGESRLLGLFEKYGADSVLSSMTALLDYGESMIAAELKNLPHGVFEAEDWIDDDGVGEEPLRVQVRIEISEDRFVADFSGSAAQTLGPINHSRAALISAVRTIFKALTNPHIPANGGCFRALEVVCPDASLFTAERPAAVSTYWETMLYVEELIWKALAEKIPERLTAGHLLSVCGIIISGVHPDTNEPIILVQPLVGGWGAMHDRDGLNGQFCIGDGETYNIPVEIQEARYGVRINHYGFHDEPGGEGAYRGGKGVRLDYEILCGEATFTASFGRHKFAPWGADGGCDGSNNYIEFIRKGDTDGRRDIRGKASSERLRQGDVVRCVTATGGGWGVPKNRQHRAIENDLRDGFVSDGRARDVYGYRS